MYYDNIFVIEKSIICVLLYFLKTKKSLINNIRYMRSRDKHTYRQTDSKNGFLRILGVMKRGEPSKIGNRKAKLLIKFYNI